MIVKRLPIYVYKNKFVDQVKSTLLSVLSSDLIEQIYSKKKKSTVKGECRESHWAVE